MKILIAEDNLTQQLMLKSTFAELGYIPVVTGNGLMACEIMLNSPAVANLIRENKVHEIPLVIETSSEAGMIPLNRYLANLIKVKEVSIENALNYSINPSELRTLLRGK